MEDRLEPLYDADGMRAIDSWAIEERGIPSLDLMEAAGLALAETALAMARSGPVRVVCGKGNNGGDGLVAARHLAGMGLPVEVLLLWPAAELSGDAATNRDRYEGELREIAAGELPRALAGSGLIVDAILGTGFSGEPREPVGSAIAAINSASAPVLAADVPSGVDAATGEVAGAAVDATATVTFHAPKLGHWIAPGKHRRGELRVAAIGIPADAPGTPAAGLIGGGMLELLPRRGAASTKFSSGQVLVAGGSRGLTGAPCMVAEAAGRAGAGYVTVAVPDELEWILEVKLTETMSLGCASSGGALAAAAAEEIVGAAERARAVVLGPGLGRGGEQVELVGRVAGRLEVPLVIDADGLNALAGRLETLAERPAATVLTPHAGELARLLERDSAQIAARRVASAREAAQAAQAIVVLKGDDTIVAAPAGRLAVNGLASPALATAGTGDVLTGVTAARLATVHDAVAAAVGAAYVHGRAGRLAAGSRGSLGITAWDVAEMLPGAIQELASGTAG